MRGAIKKIIGPIGYERDLADVKAAFNRGCYAVLIEEEPLPQSVRDEIAAAPFPFPAHEAHTRTLGYIPAQKRVFWPQYNSRFQETARWLAEENDRAIANGLHKKFNAYASKDPDFYWSILKLWVGDGALSAPWHTDRSTNKTKVYGPWCDLHIHLCGDGIVVADPGTSLQTVGVRRKTGNTALHLVAEGKADADMSTEALDRQLQERGFTLLSLQPGQKIAFRDTCLHRSSAPGGPLKIRAGLY